MNKMKKRNKAIKTACFLTALIAIALLVSACSINVSDTDDHVAVTRLDDDGYLYYMDYTKDYYGSEVINAMRKIGYIDPGCSVFCTHNVEGEPITCRNYDIAHRVSEEDQTITGTFIYYIKKHFICHKIVLNKKQKTNKQSMNS